MARRKLDGSRPIKAGGCGSPSMAVMILPSQRNCDESGVCALIPPPPAGEATAARMVSAASARPRCVFRRATSVCIVEKEKLGLRLPGEHRLTKKWLGQPSPRKEHRKVDADFCNGSIDPA